MRMVSAGILAAVVYNGTNQLHSIGQLIVDTQDPIRRIDVSHGWEVRPAHEARKPGAK